MVRSSGGKYALCVVGIFSPQSSSFSTRNHLLLNLRTKPLLTTRKYNWLGDLWEEVIEFSTYGPSERKVLKAKREAAKASASKPDARLDDLSVDSFRRAKESRGDQSSAGSDVERTSSSNGEDDAVSITAFQSAVVATRESKVDEEIDFDGYKLRDLLVDKWGIPLDIDFQRGNSGDTVYCSILPVAFGSSKCRHESELDYLMHLQGVVEVLHKYDNLDSFLFFVKKTNRVPKPGVESVPYLMDLDNAALKQIL